MTVSRSRRNIIYTEILREELKAAVGCTEPISIAYGSAYAVRVLGKRPEYFEIACSGNIIKNVKAVTVPGTGGLRGIEAAVLAGAVGGDSELGMEVLSGLTDLHRKEIDVLQKKGIVKVSLLETGHALHFIIKAFAGGENVSVEIVDSHVQIGEVWKNGQKYQDYRKKSIEKKTQWRQQLNLKDILDYADTVELTAVENLINKQIEYNMAIAGEGLQNFWGASVGKTLLEGRKDLYTRMCASAAAGSDARMNGCSLPVVINSGSGNQGLTVSVPIIVYAEYYAFSKERLYRALCAANLIAVHQKTGIGKLSAFCGVVSAAAGAVCGIAYLDGMSVDVISLTLVNTLATVGGMVCDGAKASCGAKISTALYTAFQSYEMAKQKRGFQKGEGIVKEGVEETIACVGRLASKGMRAADTEILNIMLGN